MIIKAIAIGNVIMGDDAIAIRVAEKLKPDLEKEAVEVIIGETDIDYCIESIKKADFVFILDAAATGKNPGDISMIELDSLNNSFSRVSQHQINILSEIRIVNKNVKGFLIGIEINPPIFSLELSSEIKLKFEDICESVYIKIINSTRRIKNA